MANAYGADIWELDTAATIKATGNFVHVKRLVWFPNAADNDLKVTDAAGAIIWETRAVVPAPNKENVGIIEVERHRTYNGFILVTIDGGTLHVHTA